jgi:zinc/manganese transport system ATP-binding protein
MPAAIEFADVSLSLGGRKVLDRVSLAIEPGEFIGVLGANGAGKTTMMRAALGLVAPAAGTIRILGERQARRGNDAIGYMPQSRAVPPNLRLSGFDFVASALHAERWGLPFHGPAARRQVAEALELVEAADLGARPIGALSGGQRQRLLLAQALLGSPRILLLDEPLMNLDPYYQEAVVDLVARVGRKLGLTVLFSAHEINPLLPAMSRVLYLGGGAAAIGTVDEVIRPDVLSGLYGMAIDVIRLKGRYFVMAGALDVEHSAHGHHHEEGEGHHHHDHHGHAHVRL